MEEGVRENIQFCKGRVQTEKTATTRQRVGCTASELFKSTYHLGQEGDPAIDILKQTQAAQH